MAHTLTVSQVWIYIILIMIGTMITRFLPFILFPENKKPPKFITYLSNVLSPAVMGLLVVYCLRNTEIRSGGHGIPELISIVLIIILHKLKSNVLLSILGGTACYMLLVNLFF